MLPRSADRFNHIEQLPGRLRDVRRDVPLRLVVRGDRKLLLNLLDFFRCMLPEETLDIRHKFALKIPNRIRAQCTGEAIHGFTEIAFPSRIVAVLQ